MRRVAALVIAFGLVGVALASCSSDSPSPIRIGALYPLSGPQGSGGREEYHGVQLAAQLANADGGVTGHQIQLSTLDVPGSDAAVQGVDAFQKDGIRIVLGSYGSTISAPASAAAAQHGMLFWETGAVGETMAESQGNLVFRFPPTGTVLGQQAVTFVEDQLAPLLHRKPASLRFAVANVDDVYGRSVAAGALHQLGADGLNLVGRFPYDPQHWRFSSLVRRMAKVKPDVLFVAAYVDDGVALRRATVRAHLPLLASIGTSSSYCMPEFGQRLGKDAVGLFASDKPDEDTINPDGLSPSAASLLKRAAAMYQEKYGGEMPAPALAGFSAAWALFTHVMPNASAMTPEAIGRAAQSMQLPMGTLPNGSGISFGAPGTPFAGSNVRAAAIVEEWTGVDQRETVWPPRLAEAPVSALPLAG
jgi:branched-chain amino acid transport system substrate-binding protein